MYKLIVLSAVLIKLSLCGDFYESRGTYYFISYPLLKNWYEAGRYCTHHGMYLLAINTGDDTKIANEILLSTTTKYNISLASVWTSGTDLGSEGCFYWETTGYPMLYTNWANDQPDNAHNDEHCVGIQLPGPVLNDRPCETLLSFMCQSDANRMKL